MKTELDKQLDSLARKRDHAADVLGKPMLALTYQMEIDAILAGKPSRVGPPIHNVTDQLTNEAKGAGVNG